MVDEKLENLKEAVRDYLEGIVDNYEALKKLIEEHRRNCEGNFGLTLPHESWMEFHQGLLSRYYNGFFQKKYEIQIREIE